LLAHKQPAKVRASPTIARHRSEADVNPKRIVRTREAQKRIGVGHDKFYRDFIGSGLLRLVRLGPKSTGVLESDLDSLIDRLHAGSLVVPVKPAPAKRPLVDLPKRPRGRPRTQAHDHE
jgi:predicted DNA-binding transcriptional regulator AlpA